MPSAQADRSRLRKSRRQPVGRWFLTKRVWLRAATANGCLCATAMAATFVLDMPPAIERLVRAGSQFGFAHSMATIACLTLINAGALKARRAAWLFLSGSLIVTLSLVAEGAHLAPFPTTRIGGAAGALLCILGWTRLFRACWSILDESDVP